MGTGTWRSDPLWAAPQLGAWHRPRTAAAPPLTATFGEPVPGRWPPLRLRLQERASDLQCSFRERTFGFEGARVGQFHSLNADPTEFAGRAGDPVRRVVGTEGPEITVERQLDPEIAGGLLALGVAEGVGEGTDDEERDVLQSLRFIWRVTEGGAHVE